jgi:hypothetical protein
MCRAVCDQYNAYKEWLIEGRRHADVGTEHVFFDDRPPAPGTFVVRAVRDLDERTALCKDPSPAIFVASSGMLIGGPSVSYARALARDPKSAIFLVGYQDEESAGGKISRIARGEEEGRTLRFEGVEVELQCEVRQYNLSAHADALGIEAVLESLRPALMLLVHGTPTRLARLAHRLEEFAVRHGIETRVEVSHTAETVEAEGAGRHESLMFEAPERAPSAWTRRFLEGVLPGSAVESSPVTPYISAVLQMPRNQPVSHEELFRRSTPGNGLEVIDPVEMERMDALVRRAGTRLWKEVRVGRDWCLVPVGPDTGVSLAQADQAWQMMRSRPWKALRPGQTEAEYHWARVREMGVQEGDLILCVSSDDGYPRLLPVVTLSEAPYGFSAIGSGLPDPSVAVNQIVSRVGPWPSYSGIVEVFTPADWRLLEDVSRAVEKLQVMGATQGAQPEPGSADAALAALWRLVPRGVITYVAASAASILLVRGGKGGVHRFRLLDLVQWMGGTGAVAPASAYAALGELQDSGILVLESDGDTLSARWALRTLAAFEGQGADLPPGIPGPLVHLLRRSISRALLEIEEVGLSSMAHSNELFLPVPPKWRTGRRAGGGRLAAPRKEEVGAS